MVVSQTGRRMSSACGLLAALALNSQAIEAANTPARSNPGIGHVFILMLENEGYHTTFGPKSRATYLNQLKRQGAFVSNYFGTSHFSLGNYIALVSGQAPNPVTDYDCAQFTEFVATGATADGQAIGSGCIYPASVPTIANQLEAKGLSWKAYMEDMGNNPERESATCGHPQIGAPDNTQQAQVGDQYASRHDPFVYFHGIIDTPSCAQRVVNLSELTADLQSIDATPNYVFITPNLCNDGHDGGEHSQCVDGAPGGLVSADRFLQTLVPQIMASPAFRRDGLLIITFDESDIESDYDATTNAITIRSGDAAACCHEPPGPNIPAYQAGAGGARNAINGPGLIGPGGGHIGAVMLSPFIRPGTISRVPYNHYSLLRSVEDIFGVSHLGFAGQPGLKGFGADIFTQPNGRNR
ncbi:MAG: alkaline phosphatase family protein [Steroidobacterales bacterium]